MNSKTTMAMVAIIGLVIGGGGGYFGATKVMAARNPRGAMIGNFRQAGGPGGSGKGQLIMAGSGRIMGTVQTMADGRLTIKTPNNNSQIILVNDSTTYQKMTSGTATDVSTGTQVLVMGQSNPDGSTTASSIQIMPASTPPNPQ